MRVVRIHGSGRLQLHDEPVPTPGEGEVLVRVKAVGIWYREGRIGGDGITAPFVLDMNVPV